MIHRRWLITAALLSLAVATPLILPGRGQFKAGARALESGDLTTAISTYSELASHPRATSATLYNLGNSWYQAGDPARALVWWRAASLRNPRNPNLGHNVALARAELDPRTLPVGVHRTWMLVLTPAELMLLSLPLFAGFTWQARRWRTGRTHWTLMGGAATLALLVSISAFSGHRAVDRAPIGVVTAEHAVVRIAPDPREAEQFSLPRGTEVFTGLRMGGFTLVETGDHRMGWVPANTIVLPTIEEDTRLMPPTTGG